MEYVVYYWFFYITIIAVNFWVININKTQIGHIIYSYANAIKNNNQDDVNYIPQNESEYKQWKHETHKKYKQEYYWTFHSLWTLIAFPEQDS